jgi:hypothetical protein
LYSVAVCTVSAMLMTDEICYYEMIYVLQHKNDDEFAMNVEKNSLRYLRHFEDVADELLPSSIGVDQDVYDILNVSD